MNEIDHINGEKDVCLPGVIHSNSSSFGYFDELFILNRLYSDSLNSNIIPDQLLIYVKLRTKNK